MYLVHVALTRNIVLQPQMMCLTLTLRIVSAAKDHTSHYVCKAFLCLCCTEGIPAWQTVLTVNCILDGPLNQTVTQDHTAQEALFIGELAPL